MEPSNPQPWLFYFRLACLGVAAFLLPALVPLSLGETGVLVALAAVLLVTWSAPLWAQWWRRELLLGLSLAAEALVVGWAIAAFGGMASPLTLLLLPILAQAALALGSAGYALVTAVVLSAYGVAIAGDLDPAFLPLWAPVFAAGLLLALGLLGKAGACIREAQARYVLEHRQHRRYRDLVEAVPIGDAPASRFWAGFLDQVRRGGGFRSVALIRWEGPRATLATTDREGSWRALLNRHRDLLHRGVARGGRPQLFLEEATADRPQGRTIACWPIAAHGHDGAAGVLCALADERLTQAEARDRLGRWLPIAAIAMALGTPHLTLHRADVDWRTLMTATLKRLNRRLAQHLVLVHVDPGQAEVDPLLLSDAIAHVIEAALDRAAPQSRVRVSLRRERSSWRFETETAPSTAAVDARRPHAGPPRAGLWLARQVVAAHGGKWQGEDAGTSGACRVGFTLPAHPTPPPATPPSTDQEARP